MVADLQAARLSWGSAIPWEWRPALMAQVFGFDLIIFRAKYKMVTVKQDFTNFRVELQ
jgi:hypothetical protein